MTGEHTVVQEALFYSFNLELPIPADHMLRSIDRFVDLTGTHEHLQPFYSETGRPSIDPELMIRMLIIGYCMGIRSERRLFETTVERGCMAEGLVGGEGFAVDASPIRADANRQIGGPADRAATGCRPTPTIVPYVTSRRERKKVEMLFAHLKRILKPDRLRLQGPNGAKDEFLLAATARNLRKMAKIIPMPVQMAPA